MPAPRHNKRSRIPWHKLLTLQGYVTPEMLVHEYRGAGSEVDPYLITFLDDDPGDPMQFAQWLRWTLCLVVGYVTFSVAFISSAYAGGVRDISKDLGGSAESVTLGLSLFLIGFILGPFIWAPSSGKAITGTRSLHLKLFDFAQTNTGNRVVWSPTRPNPLWGRACGPQHCNVLLSGPGRSASAPFPVGCVWRSSIDKFWRCHCRHLPAKGARARDNSVRTRAAIRPSPRSDHWWICGGHPRLALVDGDDGSAVRVRAGCSASPVT